MSVYRFCRLPERGVRQQGRAFRAVSWGCQTNHVPTPAGPHGQYSHRCPARTRPLCPRLHAGYLSTRPRLAIAAILTTGRRTFSNLLRTLGHLAVGAPSSYHRVLSEAHWSGLRLAALLTR